MARETAAQKRTRIAMLLADFANRNAELRKLMKIVEGLKEQVKEVAPGDYGDWTRAQGTPREITDFAAVKAYFAERGDTVPTRMSEAPIIVTAKAGR